MVGKVEVKERTPIFSANIVPFQIQHTGPANTKDFFSQSRKTEKVNDQEVEVVYFRGRKLVGKKLQLKENYKGYLLNMHENVAESKESGHIGTTRNYETIAKFDDLILYGQDDSPESSDQWNMVGEWQEISEAIHS